MQIDPMADFEEYNAMLRFESEMPLVEDGDLVAYLCSEQASYLTGQRVTIDGGADQMQIQTRVTALRAERAKT